MNRGSALPRDHAAPIYGAASMRPRFMNRGSRAAESGPPRADPASMRPRFMNRGSRSGNPRSGPLDARFNEAPIHESGKFLPLMTI